MTFDLFRCCVEETTNTELSPEATKILMVWITHFKPESGVVNHNVLEAVQFNRSRPGAVDRPPVQHPVHAIIGTKDDLHTYSTKRGGGHESLLTLVH